MEKSRDLSIIIVNWNSAEFVRKCIRSIIESTSEINYEILVIDNASFDGCDEVLREFGPNVKYIQSEKNLGFSKANNLAAQASSGAGLLFLNPDTQVVGEAINVLHRALHSLPSVGAVGARLLNSDGSLQTSCIQAFPTILNQFIDSDFLRGLTSRSKLWGMDALFAEKSFPMEVDAISGACLLVKREVFEEVGGFSADFFMYAEDIDISHKLKHAGRRNYYIPSASLIHFGGGSSRGAFSKFSAVMTRESTWRFLQKSRGQAYALGYRISMWLSASVRLSLLIVAFPIQKLLGRNPSWETSFRKWQAILSWSVNGEKWLEQYR
jgi:N-acetylglucosaminyl-diphospho-decaprenol L-rhamnosyltransferase